MASSFRLILFASCWLLSFSLHSRADGVLVLAAADQTYNPAPHLHYMVDETGTLTVDTLPTDPARWQALAADNLNLGYEQKPVWVKWQVRREASAATRWYLILKYAMLDYVDVYQFDPGLNTVRQHTQVGDQQPFGQRPLAHPHFIVPFTLDSTDTTGFVLRIQTESSFQAPISIVEPEWFWQQDRVRALLEGGTYFICLIMAVYNFVLFLFLRDRGYLYYVLYIVFLVLALGANRGWGFEFLWPGYPQVQDYVVLLSMLAGVASAYAFASAFMRLNTLAPRLQRIFRGMIVLSGLFTLVVLSQDQSVSARIAVVYSLFSALALALMALGFWYRTRTRQAALYCISWAILLSGASLYMGNKLGFLPMNFFTEEGLRIGVLLEMIFLSFALADRVNQDRAATEAAQRSVIELQKSMNEELEKQVKSRTQELEYLNHLLLQASITDSLTATANRRHFDDMLDKEYRRASRDDQTLALLMVDLDYFKKINDSHGHLVGDICLQKAAGVLINCIKRPPDIVARYGGEEFAVLLPNTPLEGACVVAENIRQQISALKISIPSGEQVRLTASIGVAAHQPRQRDSQAQLVQEADTALYQAKHTGRNRVVAAGASAALLSAAGNTAP